MHRKEFLEILQMIEGETVMLVTKALNNNSSHLIATTKMNIKTEDDFLVINNSTEDKRIIYYIPYNKILEVMEC